MTTGVAERLVDRGQPTAAVDDNGNKGFLGYCWSCGHDGQVITVGCSTVSHYYCDCTNKRWVCLPCWWRDWR